LNQKTQLFTIDTNAQKTFPLSNTKQQTTVNNKQQVE